MQEKALAAPFPRFCEMAGRSKLGHVVRSPVCSSSEVYMLLTDRAATAAQIAPHRELGVDVRHA